VRPVSVDRVDVCPLLEADVYGSNVLAGWSQNHVLARYRHVEDLVDDVRALGTASDDAVNALLHVGAADDRAVETLIVALLPLALSRCGGSRDRVDELIGELAIVIAEAAVSGLPPSSRRLANVLLDRAWAQVRLPARRVREPVVADPVEFNWRLVDPGPDPSEVAVGRVALEGLVQSMASAKAWQATTVRAWNTAVTLAGLEQRTYAERIRLKYARKVLRRAVPPELVA
jgi:hypothetical protein